MIHLPKQKTDDGIDIQIELGPDKKLKVVKKVIINKNELPNEDNKVCNIIKGEHSISDKSHESGMQLYLKYFKTNFEKFSQNNSYLIYNKKQIKEKLKEEINNIISLLNIKYDYAYYIMKHYNFNSESLIEDWFSDSTKVLRTTNLMHLTENELYEHVDAPQVEPQNNEPNKNCDPDKFGNNSDKNTKFTCPILLNECSIEDTYALDCGHRFSNKCWIEYLKTGIENDLDEHVIHKKCIHTECKYFVKKNDWKVLCDKNMYKQYKQLLINVYIKKSYNLRNCPNDACEYTIESMLLLKDSKNVNNNSKYKNVNIICKCGYNFCFICSEPFHRPVRCSIIKTWNQLQTKGDQNIQWINANTKKCPNCDKPIEKTSGCMNIKCMCGFSFCWLCLKEWTSHKGGFYNCNKYLETPNEKSTNKEEVEKGEKKKSHLEINKYNHYKTRFDAQEHVENFTINSQLYFLHNFCKINNLDINKLKKFEDSLILIIKYRQILKWSYALSYLSNWDNLDKKNMFEYYQGELERNLENLQQKIENINLTLIINNTNHKSLQEINELTKVNDVYFKNISTFIENNFSN
ncbi:IBR domain protein, putative [Plasmodium chabaudi chabaudi]|uniref:RBR-type E3 ubiquitin transferase n=1 Tax=Plasmodium chabaudi chabaudi TaxID=31271 RepID=A0A1D3LBL2_PLACU|nr:IBR domain protein, putative [Plasmodium chabaudi chabaudi]